MKIKDYKCKCGHEDFFFADKGNQKGIYCSYCGKWLKWADKDEQNLEMKQDAIIDKIKAEIEYQEKWLLEAGYNAYNLDIAFNSIKSALIESKECGIQRVKQVERSKIDKAFSEIEKLFTESVRVNPWEEDYRKGLMKAMAIIERNVGEKNDKRRNH